MTPVCRAAYLIAMTLLVLGCGQHPEPKRPQTPHWVLSRTLQEAVSHPDQTLRAARTHLALADGSTVSDCNEYLGARRRSAQLAEQVAAKLAASEYLVCDVLCFLPRARSASDHPPLERGRELATRLDLRSFRSSLRPMVNDDAPTIDAVSGQLQTSGDAVTLQLTGWQVNLEVVAEADLNGDGRADWLVWLSDEASDASYRDYRTLVVLSASAAGPLRAADLWPDAAPSDPAQRFCAQDAGVELSGELGGLPMDGAHLVEFWWLDGDGAHAGSPLGQFSAWYGRPMQLGDVQRGTPTR